MLQITVTETGGRQLVAAFDELAYRLRDLTPVWPTIRDLFYEFETRAFDSEGASSAAGRWAGLSEQYSIWKAKHYPGRLRLERTGALRASLTREGFGSTVTMQPERLDIESEVEYGHWHQSGTTKMPARPPIALRTDQVAAFASAIHRWLDRDVMKSLVSRVAAEQRREMAGVA